MSGLNSIMGKMRINLTEKEQEKLTENLLLNGECFRNDCAFGGSLCL